jgi:hypothetical protein
MTYFYISWLGWSNLRRLIGPGIHSKLAQSGTLARRDCIYSSPIHAFPLSSLQSTTMKIEGSLMAWLFILMADVFEVAWPFALKWSVKFSGWSPLIVQISL